MVSKEEVGNLVRAKIEEITRQRKPRILSEELALSITSTLSVQILVKRAYIPPDLPEGTFQIVIQTQPDDLFAPDGSLAMMIQEVPEGFEETPIKRNKKASKDEFKQQLATFKKDSRKLSMECNKAARKAGLAKSAVAAFAGARKNLYPATMPIAKIRFMKAVRKVIVINTVAKITKLLEKYERNERKSMDEIPSPSMADFRKVMDFDSIVTSTSLPSLSALPRMGNGKRGSRPHHRLRPIKKGVDGLVLDSDADTPCTTPRLSLPSLEGSPGASNEV
jgi:hypothetical protein